MDKNTYLRIRGELNFTPCPTRLRNQAIQDLGLLTLAGWLLLGTQSLVAYALSQLALACLYFRAFGMMHEAVHGSLSKSRPLNDWLGVIYGGICFLPFATWRSVHLEHHAWAGNADKDPVMRIVREFPTKPAYQQKIDTLLWRSWLPYMAVLQEMVFWAASAKLALGKGNYRGKYWELVASVGAPTFVFFGLVAAGHARGSVLLCVPSVITYLAMVEIVNFPHHLNLPRLEGEGKLSLREQYKITRTCVYSSWISRYVLLNFNYHAEHHLFPTLPWPGLAEAHEKIKTLGLADYEMCKGNEWILVNRNRDLKEVLAPTKILNAEADGEKMAA